MTERSVVHSTFELERRYPLPPARVFAAWSDPAVKRRWFVPDGAYELDFRVGGREGIRSRHADGFELTLASHYQDIVDGERIVYTSALARDGVPVTVSLTTALFRPAGEGTELLLTEQATFLDGHEDPSWREQGTGSWLDALGEELSRTADR